MRRFIRQIARALPTGLLGKRPANLGKGPLRAQGASHRVHAGRFPGISLGFLAGMNLGLGALLYAENAGAANSLLVFTVNTKVDPDTYVPRLNGTCGDGNCSLRAAIEEANALSQQGSYYFNIYIPGGTYKLNRQLVVKGSPSGTRLFIRGAGADSTIIDGQRQTRVLDIAVGALVTMRALMIQNGRAGKSDDAVVGSHYHGGGIHNHGTLLMENSALSGNYSPGGLVPGGNCVEACGGGLYNAGVAGLVNVTFSYNNADGGGGAIANSGSLDLHNVTIADNLAPNGGGLYNAGNATIFGTILANNDGIYPGNNCGWPVSGLPKPPLADSVLNLEYSVSAPNSNSCGVAVSDPGLDPVRNRFGAAIYYRIYSWSPAIDHLAFNGRCPAFDQRGIARPQDGNGDLRTGCDIGAYERRPRKDP